MHWVVSIIILAVVQFGFSQPLINEVTSSNITGIHDEYDADQTNCPVADCDWWYTQMGQSTEDGDYPDWIEIYNPENQAIQLYGYGLSDDPSDPMKWQFPPVLIAPKGFLFVFASGKDRKTLDGDRQHFHTNFKIDRNGETLILTDNSGTLCDRAATGEIPIDFSLGRHPDGATDWVVYHQPTPGESNSTPPFPGFTDTITASHASGFYGAGIDLILAAKSPTAEIRFTRDGDDPTNDSESYSQPLSITQTTVVKARAFENGIVSSPILCQTYFIHETFTFPVLSLSTPPDNLWDQNTGIYVAGRNADEGNRIANYWQDWERPIHIEFFEPDGSPGFAVDAGIQIFGWGSRTNPIKSLAIMIRDKYGCAELAYPLFPDLPIQRFESFILRAGASDWQGSYFRDPLATELVKDKNVDRQAFRPAVVFINGQYWGIHDIREKLNEDYLASHYGVDPDNVDVISRYWRRSYPVVSAGDDEAYLALESFLENHDLKDSQNDETIRSLIDVDNLIDYLVTQIYLANYDWPGNNNKCWRSRAANGRWRWLLYDLDYWYEDPSYNMLAHATAVNNPGWPNPPQTTFLIRKMFESETFKRSFINRLADFMNSVFLPERMIERIDSMQALYEPEMGRHIDCWKEVSSVQSMSDWERNIEFLRDFARKRPLPMRQHVCQKFNLTGFKSLTLKRSPDTGGQIQINSLLIDQFPWQGDYFTQIPIQVTATPYSGYRFTHWQGSAGPDSTAKTLTLTLSAPMTVTACFEKKNEISPALIFNEIYAVNAAGLDPGDWVEIYNPQAGVVDVSRWIFKDSEDLHTFVIPANTVINANGCLVLCRDQAAFQECFPQIQNCAGHFDFGLDGDHDIVRLFNAQGILVDSLSYFNASPWPVIPREGGATLALKSPDFDNAIPQNWGLTPGYGSPGCANTTVTQILTEDSSALPNAFMLEQNYPNPFNAVTRIGFHIPRRAPVRVIISDIEGRTAAVLMDQTLSSGKYTLMFDGSELPSGLYFCRLEAGSFRQVKKIVLIK